MTPILHQAIAFQGQKCIAAGQLLEVALFIKPVLEADPAEQILVFSGVTGDQIDLDLRGTATDIASRYGGSPEQQEAEAPDRRAGRPKLGVIAREVTLLPRHWAWLATQPGGASAALRRLVDEARKASGETDARRAAQNRAYRFMTAMAGNAPGYEEAVRALFAGSGETFDRETASWPADVRKYARILAEGAFA